MQRSANQHHEDLLRGARGATTETVVVNREQLACALGLGGEGRANDERMLRRRAVDKKRRGTAVSPTNVAVDRGTLLAALEGESEDLEIIRRQLVGEEPAGDADSDTNDKETDADV